jgi:holo-[acyl-carrier protein] synthase
MNVGVDVVDVERFRTVLERTPRFARRYFTEAELQHCSASRDPVLRLAGTLAAKEATMKVMNLTPAPAWARRIEIRRGINGSPTSTVHGQEVSISISHDGGVAVAVAAR